MIIPEDFSKFLPYVYPHLCWKIATEEKKIYLTFDDGPIPFITEKILDILDGYQAKATFFCVGQNAERHSEILVKIHERNHSIGNHSYHHLKGWQTPTENYVADILNANTVLENLTGIQIKLFRPPYGRITPAQIKILQHKYKIIMWNVITCDYHKNFTPEKCLQRAIGETSKGSIVVFHDSIKSERNVLYALPKYLEYFSAKGFTFEKL